MPGVHHNARRRRGLRAVHLARGRCAPAPVSVAPRLAAKHCLCAVDFFSHLEMHLRQESQPLCGRDQLSYRSSYFPVKDVVDGDMCEMFTSLPHEKQRQIAEELDR